MLHFVLGALCIWSGLTTSVQAVNVFGKDDRVAIDLMGTPKKYFHAVGQVKFDGSHCTATLIGADLILSNAHCLVNSTDAIFYAGYMRGKYLRASHVIEVWHLPSDQGTFLSPYAPSEDAAIGLLEKPIGRELGWLQIAAPAALPVTVTTLGYPADRGFGGELPVVQENCVIHRVQDGYLDHDCDHMPGASGSPMLRMSPGQAPAIIAIQQGSRTNEDLEVLRLKEYDPTYANTSVSGEVILRLLKMVQNERRKGLE